MSHFETGAGMDQRTHEHAHGYFPRCLIWFTSSWRDTKDNRERIDSRCSSFSQFPPTHTCQSRGGHNSTRAAREPQRLQRWIAENTVSEKLLVIPPKNKRIPLKGAAALVCNKVTLNSGLINEAATFFPTMLHHILVKLLQEHAGSLPQWRQTFENCVILDLLCVIYICWFRSSKVVSLARTISANISVKELVPLWLSFFIPIDNLIPRRCIFDVLFSPPPQHKRWNSARMPLQQ